MEIQKESGTQTSKIKLLVLSKNEAYFVKS